MSATFTMLFKDVIARVYGTTANYKDYVQEYDQVTYQGITYGKLPVLPNYDGIGLGYYPIFDENYRKVINGKIIDEYFNREIGTETIENFTLNLRKKMDQIMPYFNQIYKSVEIPYDALDNMRIHSVGKNTIQGTESVNTDNTTGSDSTSKARAVGSNFPQVMLSGNGDYASTGNDTNSEGTVSTTAKQNSDSTNSNESSSDNLVTGYQGAASDLINKYRASLINPDTMVLAEIEECFMLVFNNGDSYTTRDYGW